MAKIRPSLDWLDDLAAISAQREKTPSASHAKLAKTLDLTRSYVSNLLAIKPIFDLSTVEKVRQAAPAFIFSYYSAKVFAGLRGKAEDLAKVGQESLEQVLTHRLTPKQIEALVDHIARAIG